MSLLEGLLIAYAAVGCAYWGWMAVGAWLTARRVVALGRLSPPSPPEWPRLSVVVPACNEADSIQAAAATLLGQDYPDLELVLVDDRSQDATGRLIDQMAAQDPRVRPVHVTRLPEGWLGKVHALAQGLEQSSGPWVLFSDADVHFLTPDTLRKAVAWAEHRKLDFMAAAPEIWSPGILLDALVSAFARVGCVVARCWSVGNPKSSAFVGIGAFNLVRRDAFARTEGFPWLRLEVTDDLALGLLMKRSGARCCVVNALGHVGLTWYRSLGQMAWGVEKAYASVGGCSMARMMALCAAVTAMELAPLVALLPWGVPLVNAAGLLMAALAATSVVLITRWARRRVLPALLFPLAVPVGIAMLLRAGWLGMMRGGVAWRGTLYPSRTLREGRRIRVFY